MRSPLLLLPVELLPHGTVILGRHVVPPIHSLLITLTFDAHGGYPTATTSSCSRSITTKTLYFACHAHSASRSVTRQVAGVDRIASFRVSCRLIGSVGS